MTVRNLGRRLRHIETRIDVRIKALHDKWGESLTHLSSDDLELLIECLRRIETNPKQATVSLDEAAVLRRLLEHDEAWAAFHEAYCLTHARSRAFPYPARDLAIIEAIARHGGRDLSGGSQGA